MRRRIRALIGAAALVGLAFAPMTPAQAADVVYASGPGGMFTGWTQPVIVIRPGDTITYVNIDIALHDVVADGVYGPDEPWCNEINGYQVGECPLFGSGLAGLAESKKVHGLNRVKPGQSVPFICTLHQRMKGTLIMSQV